MGEQRDDTLRAEDVADAASSDAPEVAQPSEERLAAASPDDAAGAAAGGDAQADAAAEGAAAAGADPAGASAAGDAQADAAAEGRAAAAADGGAATEPDFRDQYVRAMAELDNVRKRARRDVAAAQEKGVAKLARELLPAIDDLERALAHAAEDDPLRAGVKSVLDRMLASLAKLGIEVDAPEGERFDPHRHEAIAQQPVEGAESGTIVQVYSNGYRLGEDVLRAAKVVVAA